MVSHPETSTPKSLCAWTGATGQRKAAQHKTKPSNPRQRGPQYPSSWTNQ